MKTGIQNSGVRIQKGAVRFLACFFLAASALAEPEGEMRYERAFADAAKAYDEKRLPDAIAGWQSLVDEGQRLPEVLFNLGNAYYRNGELGPAIRAYREAQRLAPRDPDIRANLGFAAQSTGIPLPGRHPLAALLLDFSEREWRGFGLACFWLLCGAAAAGIAWPRSRFLARPAAGVLAALLLVALASLGLHRDLRKNPECVVMQPGQKILASPLDTATPLLAVPAGALVRKLDERGTWCEVRGDGTRGWLPAAVLAAIE